MSNALVTLGDRQVALQRREHLTETVEIVTPASYSRRALLVFPCVPPSSVCEELAAQESLSSERFLLSRYHILGPSSSSATRRACGLLRPPPCRPFPRLLRSCICVASRNPRVRLLPQEAVLAVDPRMSPRQVALLDHLEPRQHRTRMLLRTRPLEGAARSPSLRSHLAMARLQDLPRRKARRSRGRPPSLRSLLFLPPP